jgi:hypothetical protein
MSADPRVVASAALRLELAGPVPPEVPAGADLVLQVRVSGATCELGGSRIEVVAGEKIAATAQLIAFHGNVNETAPFSYTRENLDFSALFCSWFYKLSLVSVSVTFPPLPP